MARVAEASSSIGYLPRAGVARFTDSEFLLHDALHLQPYTPPVPRAPIVSTSAAVAAAAVIVPPLRSTVRRLTPSYHGSGGIGVVAVPTEPFDATAHARDAIFHWQNTRHSVDLGAIGRPLLVEYLNADAALARQRRRWDPYAGNALRVLAGTDGEPMLLHAQGEDMHTLAVRAVAGHAHPSRHHHQRASAGDAAAALDGAAAESALCTCTLPPDVRDRILQVALCASDDLSAPRRVLARSTYWLHHFELAEEVRQGPGGATAAAPRRMPTLRHVASAKHGGGGGGAVLKRRPLHVALSPALRDETACLLDDGRVQLLRLDRTAAAKHASSAAAAARASNGSSAGRRSDAEKPRASPYALADVGRVPLAASATPVEAPSATFPPEEAWGRVEYAEHPRTLYVGSGLGLHLLDVRAPGASPVRLFDVRRLPLPELRAGAMAIPTSTRLRPLAGAAAVPAAGGASAGGASAGAGAASGGGAGGSSSAFAAPLIALASSEQLVVLDARSAAMPLLQLRLPLPLPPAKPLYADAPALSPQVPRYSVDFGPRGDVIELVELTTARPYVVALPGQSCGSVAEGAGGTAAAAAAWAAWAGGGGESAEGVIKTWSPRPPPLPRCLDVDGMLSRRAALAEAYAADSALPLAGAAIFAMPRRRPTAGGSSEDAGGGYATATWAIASLSRRGHVDLLCDEEEAPPEGEGDAAAENAGAADEGAADEGAASRVPRAIVDALHAAPPAVDAMAARSQGIAPRRDARREAVLDELRVMHPKVTAKVMRKLSKAGRRAERAAERRAADDVPLHLRRAAASAASTTSASAATAAAPAAAARPGSGGTAAVASDAGASAPLPIPPFEADEEDDPLVAQMAAQWDGWAATTVAGPPIATPAPAVLPSSRLPAARDGTAARMSLGSSSMPPPPPREPRSSCSPGMLTSTIGAVAPGKRKSLPSTTAPASAAAAAPSPAAGSSSTTPSASNAFQFASRKDNKRARRSGGGGF